MRGRLGKRPGVMGLGERGVLGLDEGARSGIGNQGECEGRRMRWREGKEYMKTQVTVTIKTDKGGILCLA